MDPGETPRERLCRAFRRAYELADLTQDALSALTGIKQATISKYARGETTPPVEALEKVDAACGRPRGHVLRLADYVTDDEVDLVVAIERDRGLGEDERSAMLLLYRTFLKRSER